MNKVRYQYLRESHRYTCNCFIEKGNEKTLSYKPLKQIDKRSKISFAKKIVFLLDTCDMCNRYDHRNCTGQKLFTTKALRTTNDQSILPSSPT